MKLNLDCLRDVLLYTEENIVYENTSSLKHNFLTVRMVIDGINNNHTYDENDVSYSLEQLYKDGFIEAFTKGNSFSGYDIFYIYGITGRGHELLNAIRPKTLWEKTKIVAKKLGSGSVNLLCYIAKTIYEQQLNTHDFIDQIISSVSIINN